MEFLEIKLWKVLQLHEDCDFRDSSVPCQPILSLYQIMKLPFKLSFQLMSLEASAAGIPICQQHLIWNNMELEDDYCLNYYNISEGCTLKLVLAMRGGPINTSRGECTHHLPPVKAPVQTKKKTTKHCFLCGKKTGLATSYECRCGNNFCASHRYAETHSCTYDYKSAGRRYLQEANPAVNAPKLPKI